MKISLIIPTHNRADSLRRALESVVALNGEADFEVVVVDNNCTDHTKDLVAQFSSIARYVFESNTSFTKARHTGAEHAVGDVLVYLDDDVMVQKGALKAICAVFSRHADCGVIAAKILPRYECEPPDWAIACQQVFNGWSLYHPGQMPALGSGLQVTGWAAGPMMALSRQAYDTVKGFPPDTVGVETNTGKSTFRKLYIGPGDYGICLRICSAGYKVYYSPDVCCYHVIPKLRFTVPFWRSRMIGEGHHLAITNREFHRMRRPQLIKERKRIEALFGSFRMQLSSRLEQNEKYLAESGFDGMLTEELWLHYSKAYLGMDAFLDRHEGISQLLWTVGSEGVSARDFDQTTRSLPPSFWALVSPEKMFTDEVILTPAALRERFPVVTSGLAPDCPHDAWQPRFEGVIDFGKRVGRNLLPPILTTQIPRLIRRLRSR